MPIMPTRESALSDSITTQPRYAMLQTMAQMQDAHNTLVHAQWRTQGYAYYRAIWVECAELLDHFGWKWWKKQDGDLAQVKLELVDIWHFALSEMLRQGSFQSLQGVWVMPSLMRFTIWVQRTMKLRYRKSPGRHSRILGSDSG